jgi:transcriptional regulator with XRE-family HTH domain
MGDVGRPKIEFDLVRVEDLGALGATQEEMAARFECSNATISRAMADENSPFCKAYKRGLADLKETLRRKMISLAKGGNVTMCIWLSKQWLGMSDKLEQRIQTNQLEEIEVPWGEVPEQQRSSE